MEPAPTRPGEGRLGVQRVFRALLIEGKEPPRIEDLGEALRVSLRSSDLSVPFRTFVAEEGKRGVELSVDHLLVLRHLLRHPEIDAKTAAGVCQRPEPAAREILAAMDRSFGYLERGGTGRGACWALRAEIHARLAAPGHGERDRGLDREAVKARILRAFEQRAGREEDGLSNQEIRQMTQLDRNQVKRLMNELGRAGRVVTRGRGRAARWYRAGEA